MTDITPADLARFVHPVPVGAVIPAATEHAVRIRSGGPITVMTMAYDHEQRPGALDRWTAEPPASPKPPLAERVREFASEVLAAPPVGFSSVILDVENQQNRWIAEAAALLAEIAERLDAGR